MKKVLAILLMAALMLTASTLSVYADEGEEDEEGEEGGSGGDDDEERGAPGFEIAFAIAGALAAKRLIGRKE